MFAYKTKRETITPENLHVQPKFKNRTMERLLGKLRLHWHAFYAMYLRLTAFFQGASDPRPIGSG